MDLTVLLIDADRERAAMLQAALLELGYRVSSVLSSDDDWHQRILTDSADVILINMDSPDRDTFEYLTSLKENRPKPVVMFANDDDRQVIQAAVKAGVSAYVTDSINLQRLRSILDVAVARFSEYQVLRDELQAAKLKLSERKLIEKAKGILMQRKGISEEAAYRCLRKLAMDRNAKIAEVAEQLIQYSDLLN